MLLACNRFLYVKIGSLAFLDGYGIDIGLLPSRDKTPFANKYRVSWLFAPRRLGHDYLMDNTGLKDSLLP